MPTCRALLSPCSPSPPALDARSKPPCCQLKGRSSEPPSGGKTAMFADQTAVGWRRCDRRRFSSESTQIGRFQASGDRCDGGNLESPMPPDSYRPLRYGLLGDALVATPSALTALRRREMSELREGGEIVPRRPSLGHQCSLEAVHSNDHEIDALARRREWPKGT